MTPTATKQHKSSTGSPNSPSAGLQPTFVAFADFSLVAKGDLRTVASAIKQTRDQKTSTSLLILDATTSRPMELDLRGGLEDVLARLPEVDAPGPSAGGERAGAMSDSAGDRTASAPRGAGRPRLGVVAREVTLLPRHWAWLADQPGGASAALRRLVDQARVDLAGRDALRHAQESAYRFMSTLLGDQSDYDEAARALFAGHREAFHALVQAWPADARDHLLSLAERVFAL